MILLECVFLLYTRLHYHEYCTSFLGHTLEKKRKNQQHEWSSRLYYELSNYFVHSENFIYLANFRSILHSLSRIAKRGEHQGARSSNRVAPAKTDQYGPLHGYQIVGYGTVSFADAGNSIIISRDAERRRSTPTRLETVLVCSSLETDRRCI